MEKETYTHDLLNYISWESLCDDFGLKSGDISITQEITLNKILNQFINQNE